MNLDLDLLFSDYLYIAHKLERDKARKYCPLLEGRILDVGCGRKPYKAFLNENTSYIGMEYIDNSLKPDVFGDAQRLPYKSETFDGAICNEVIEHLAEPSAAFKEMNRVLKKGGKLYLTAPMSWRLHYQPNDYYRFTNFGLSYMLENNGFRIIEIERFGGFFSLVFVRLIDIFVTKIFFKVMSVLSIERGKYHFAALLAFPFSLLLYFLGQVLDGIDKDDSFAWAVFAEKNSG